MKKSLLNLITVFAFVMLFSACSSTVEEPKPSNEIESSNGLKITLEWETGSSTTQAISDADLDLYLLKDNEEISRSTLSYSFESVKLENIYSDGTYTVKVKADQATKKANYTLYVTDGDGGQSKTFTGYFAAGDQNVGVDFMTIKKAGKKYTLTEL